ncbi:MAG: hypothetical protein QUU85_17810 [Candidatus Eisenbacteria bacterium]|nr:hypothetical protein [Candidatus Eisenbacteria bacterium]
MGEQRARSSPPATGRLVREGFRLSAWMGASKLLGIVRESLMAWAFGTSAIVDAFRVAQSGIFLIIHVLSLIHI